jgi:hypothetical protein
MKNMKTIVTLTFLCLVLSGCSTIPPGFVVSPDDILTHRLSGTTFPVKIGSFTRVSPVSYDDQGTDISVDYQVKAPLPIVLDMYVYPGRDKNGPIGLSDHYAACVKAVMYYHPKAQAESESDTQITQTGESIDARLAMFTYDDQFGGKGQDLVSVLMLAKHKGWFILYRMTLPIAGKANAIALIVDFAQRATLPTNQL